MFYAELISNFGESSSVLEPIAELLKRENVKLSSVFRGEYEFETGMVYKNKNKIIWVGYEKANLVVKTFL